MKLVRRQLRRARKGLRVLSTKAFTDINDIKVNFNDELEKYSWMEELRSNDDIDGYVIPRVIYSEVNINGRRHSLLPDPNNLGDSHYLPEPYSLIPLVFQRSQTLSGVGQTLLHIL